MTGYKTPGVYVQEIRKLPPSVAAVETAIPAFVGYTEKAMRTEEGDLLNVPHRITSMFEYERYFGQGLPETGIVVDITQTNPAASADIRATIATPSNYKMYYALQAFFINGGGPCYIVSVDEYSAGSVINQTSLLDGLGELEKVDEVTLIVFPDAQGLSSAAEYYALQKESLDQCVELQDRFALIDVWMDEDETANNVQVLRDTLSGDVDTLKYGAVYYPNIETLFDYQYKESEVVVNVNGAATTLSDLKSNQNALYNQALSAIGQIPVELSPAPAMAGMYATVDNSRGVWKAPANVGIDFVIRPTLKITDKEQADLNVDVVAGKSINAIRSFTGRGPAVVWGARTLAGNDNEWRYVSVRRFFNFVEESVKKATVQFVFEPNDVNTWTRVKSMIENFLVLQWRAGALMGTTPQEAFFVKIGLNETMSELDILEGRMVVEIGMAVVRPAEFIILKFSHKMLQET